MADSVFNIAKGKVNEYVVRVDTNSPAGCELVQLLLVSTGLEVHSTLIDYDTVSAILAAANDEATFTNYARKILVAADLTSPAPDDTNNDQEAAVPDWVIANAGGATNNTLGAMVVAYDPLGTGVDTNLIPLTVHDLTVTTDGTQLTIAPSATSFFRAA